MDKKVHRISKQDRMDGLAESTILRLQQVLENEFEGNTHKIDDCVIDLNFAKSLGMSMDETVGDPKTMKARYRKALKAIKSLRRALSEFEVPEIETLDDLVEGFEADKVLAKYNVSTSDSGSSGLYGTTIYETHELLNVLEHVIQHAVRRIKVPRGAKPKERMRLLSLCTKEALEDCGVRVTVYDDGVFFTVLSILFEECFKDAGPDAHRRHGVYALKVDLHEMHDIKRLPPGSLYT